ncbi:MAG TPA: glycosyltransferase family 2 protein [Verrucomicrobiae bacterium]|jgi:glycosyltransferase involved in cell wall biosynthesis|nr:glycosyltransferase family 2 protein [Verrucomicrobiae bacterium]
MRLSIITPSFRSSAWLKLCIASVADQGVELEHIVQDSCSDDGTQEWLQSDRRVRAYIEKDAGMYDAVNRGMRRSSGDVVGYLNCDEEYLPGALREVSEYFDQHPRVDILFADCVVVDAEGEFLCYRKVQLPFTPHVMVATLPTFTCSMFFRRKLLDQGFYFEPKLRAVGDADWVLRALAAKIPMGILRRYVSTFADTGVNLMLTPDAQREKRELFLQAPKWAQVLAPALVAHHRLRRWLGGIYRQEPFAYAIYTKKSPEKRVTHHVAHPTFIWKSRLSWRG